MPEAREYMRKKKKEEIGMCQKQGNTCEKRKKRNRYVPEVREYMRKEKKEEIGMCQR